MFLLMWVRVMTSKAEGRNLYGVYFRMRRKQITTVQEEKDQEVLGTRAVGVSFLLDVI
jgi:hypothetical protein